VGQQGIPGFDIRDRGDPVDRADQQRQSEESRQRPDLGTLRAVLLGALGMTEDTFSFPAI
jgi:hypothetical protein